MFPLGLPGKKWAPRGLAVWCTPTVISHRHLISIENPLVEGCKVKTQEKRTWEVAIALGKLSCMSY